MKRDEKKAQAHSRQWKRESENITNTFAHMIAAIAVEEELRHRRHAVADVG